MTIDNKKTLARLLEVTRNLSSMVDLETYLQSILSAAAELTESETASLMNYDEAAQEFVFKFTASLHSDRLKDVRVPLNGSAAGWVFLHVKPLTTNDVKKDERDIASSALFDARSILGVPLIVHGRPTGVFEAFNKTSPYTEEDILIMETLASLAATAMQNDLLEKKIQSSQSEIRDFERQKNEFIAITSHELRTPLGLILGHSTFLRELVGNEHEEQVDTIIRSASKLKEIIESLSTIDNQQTGGASLRSGKSSIARIIEDVAASFHNLAVQKGVTIKVENERGHELFINADGGKIAVALSNLLKNAIAFTNEGGHIVIRGERETGFIKITVEDDGIGIPAKDQPHVFERFYQVESHLTRRHGGMGLGLSVAKAMVEMHNGHISIENVEGGGSKFIIRLPLESDENETINSSPFVE